MLPEDLLFWIVAIDADTPPDAKLLCRRHADAMVVPRGWTLDDRRQPAPSLFQTRRYDTKPFSRSLPTPDLAAATAVATSSPRRRARHAGGRAVEQLQIDGTGPIPRPSEDQLEAVAERVGEPAVEPAAEIRLIEDVQLNAADDAQADIVDDGQLVEDGTNFSAWRPEFDTDDDLDGLLETKGPLLSRAFRGTARQR